MQPNIALIVCFFAATVVSHPLMAGELERRQAKRIHDRLVGVPATNAVIDQMEAALLTDDTGVSAADIAMLDPTFYNVTIKNFAAPWTNEERDVFVPLNDYTATVIGMVRDSVDFRKILYDDIIYTDSTYSNYSNTSNSYYENMESQNLKEVLVQQTQSLVTGLPAHATAGVVTTRASAKAFFIDGTNRAMIQFTLRNHLCAELEQIKDSSRSADKVRQDVTRSPGGDSRIYLNSCYGCHAGMDGLDSAYAYYNFEYGTDVESGQLSYTDGVVQPKHLINATVFPPGHINTDDSWINYWRNGPNARLGWGNYADEEFDAKGNAIGSGLKSMGMELAHSDAFAQCQVDKAFEAICFRNPDDYATDRAQRDEILTNFEDSGYDMKQVFGSVAAWCKGD
ncbi:MAG: hypothetical protein GY820_26625 [Gammaproteobacteria bacterium]|nr:hypothetical protein [Gammaproteobacteria bacterium]